MSTFTTDDGKRQLRMEFRRGLLGIRPVLFARDMPNGKWRKITSFRQRWI